MLLRYAAAWWCCQRPIEAVQQDDAACATSMLPVARHRPESAGAMPDAGGVVLSLAKFQPHSAHRSACAFRSSAIRCA